MESKYAFYAIVILGIAALIALIFLSSRTALPSTNTLMITATGTAYNASSEAQIYLSINGSGPTNNAAIQNISNSLSEFNSTIYKFVNGNRSLVVTDYFNVRKAYNTSIIYPVGVPANGTAPNVVPAASNSTKGAYIATEGISVTLPNINNVTSALSALSQIPNLYIYSVTSTLPNSQISKLRIQALSDALSNATEQAQALIGNSTIYSKNISVNSYYFYPYRYYIAEAQNGVPPASLNITPQYYSGTSSVTESISVVFTYARNAFRNNPA